MGINVLLADDNDDDLVMVRRAFQKLKTLKILQTVQNGEEVISFLKNIHQDKKKSLPDLILLDINMPKKDGFETLTELKNDPDLKHIPVIIFTTSNRNKDIERAYSLGASSFVTKPTILGDLERIVEQFEQYWSLVAKLMTLPSSNHF